MFNFSNMSMFHLKMFLLLGSALVVTPMCRVAATASYQKHVHEQCGFTTYPSLCFDTMTKLGSGNQLQVDIVSAHINKTILETRLPTSYFTKFSSNLEVEEAQHVNSITGIYILPQIKLLVASMYTLRYPKLLQQIIIIIIHFFRIFS